MTGVDGGVERLGRWTAARTTRRSFLNRLGQVAVFVAAGPAITGLIVRAAQARVCGQSGVTPKCDTFDCNGAYDVWGWCWYASDGCCRNDGLKKICDCCTVDYPNVHGYCPSGTNVRCIVESCGNDPRVLQVALTPVTWTGATGYHHGAIGAAMARGESTAKRAVIADDGNRWTQYIAAPLAGALGVPLLGIGSAGPSAEDLALLKALAVEEVVVVGPVAGTANFTSAGIRVDQVTDDDDLPGMSRQVAVRITKVNAINRTITVEPSGLSGEAAPAAAVFAALGGFPLVVGSSTASAVGYPTLYVGPEPGSGANSSVTVERTVATNLVDLSIELADLAAALPNVAARRVAIVPAGSSDAIGMVNLGVPMVLHPPQRLGPIESWLQTHSLRYGELTEIYYTKGPGELSTEEYWKLQGSANGFRVDQLQGVSGQGLPVHRQPLAERPIGMARKDGALEWGSESPPNYWTTQGQTLRR